MATPARILVIDDEETICFAFQRYFEPRGFKVRVASSGAAGLACYASEPADIVFLDIRLPDTDGLEVLAKLGQLDPQARVVMITAYGSLDIVTRAIRGRAFDYLVKPIELDRAAALVEQALASRQAPPAEDGARPAAETSGAATLIGRSSAIQEVYKRICRVADSDSPVLILGQTGTGKELVARTIHQMSRRRAKPFVAVNCGALPENLVESELFGYARGAFTGADGEKPGRFEMADGGTLFFDEVGELPPAAQVKLLRFLDSQTIERLGSVRSLQLNVRILAATNRDLSAAIAAGHFRQDLFYRLAVIQVQLPPLAARADDMLLLAHHFLARQAPAGQPPQILSREAAEYLRAYPWPGNVRELRNVIEHAVVVSGGNPILPAHLPESLRQAAGTRVPAEPLDVDALIEKFVEQVADRISFRETVERLEKTLMLRALAESGGNQSAAAERLGLHRNTLRNRLRDLGLDT